MLKTCQIQTWLKVWRRKTVDCAEHYYSGPLCARTQFKPCWIFFWKQLFLKLKVKALKKKKYTQAAGEVNPFNIHLLVYTNAPKYSSVHRHNGKQAFDMWHQYTILCSVTAAVLIHCWSTLRSSCSRINNPMKALLLVSTTSSTSPHPSKSVGFGGVPIEMSNEGEK